MLGIVLPMTSITVIPTTKDMGKGQQELGGDAMYEMAAGEKWVKGDGPSRLKGKP